MSDGKSGVVKTVVTEEAITTDHKTYVKVAPDQECIEPLIPKEGPKEGGEPRVYFLDVILEKGSIYNPKGRPGIYGNRITIGYGVRVKGPVVGRNDVEISSGAGVLGPGIILGNVYSIGDVYISPPRKRLSDYKDGPIIIIGDVVGKNVEIRGDAIIKGSIVAEKDITIEGGSNTVIEGFVYSKTGGVHITRASCAGIIAGNYPDEEGKIGVGVKIGEKVTVYHPIIWVKNGDPENGIVFESGYVRVLRKPCFECYRNGFKSILNCPKYISGECKQFLYISGDDVLKNDAGIFASDSWRVVEEDMEHYQILGLYWESLLYSRKNEEDYMTIFEKDSYGHYMKSDDLQMKIEQKIEQKVFANPEAAKAYAAMEGKYRYMEKEMEENTKRAKMMLEYKQKVREFVEKGFKEE